MIKMDVRTVMIYKVLREQLNMEIKPCKCIYFTRL